MKELRTHIDIRAPKSKVWDILMDFEQYPEWNPFIRKISGKNTVGSPLSVDLLLPGSKSEMTMTPVVVESKENNVFAWLGSLGIKGLFDGNHIFELSATENGCRFIHRERFTGILAVLIFGIIGKKTQRGFQNMNEALRQLAEEPTAT